MQVWIQSLRETVRWIIMGRPDLNATTLRLQSDSSIDHQSLCSTNTQIWMEEHYPCHPVHKNE